MGGGQAGLRGLLEHDRRRLENQPKAAEVAWERHLDEALIDRDMERIFTEDWA